MKNKALPDIYWCELRKDNFLSNETCGKCRLLL